MCRWIFDRNFVGFLWNTLRVCARAFARAHHTKPSYIYICDIIPTLTTNENLSGISKRKTRNSDPMLRYEWMYVLFVFFSSSFFFACLLLSVSFRRWFFFSFSNIILNQQPHCKAAAAATKYERSTNKISTELKNIPFYTIYVLFVRCANGIPNVWYSGGCLPPYKLSRTLKNNSCRYIHLAYHSFNNIQLAPAPIIMFAYTV